jgi:hypothetical protein
MSTTSPPTMVKAIKDPQPSVDRIDDLAKRILNGDIYLPKFQREFVWERRQVLDLLDSVARNYPIAASCYGKANRSCAARAASRIWRFSYRSRTIR